MDVDKVDIVYDVEEEDKINAVRIPRQVYLRPSYFDEFTEKIFVYYDRQINSLLFNIKTVGN